MASLSEDPQRTSSEAALHLLFILPFVEAGLGESRREVEARGASSSVKSHRRRPLTRSNQYSPRTSSISTVRRFFSSFLVDNSSLEADFREGGRRGALGGASISVGVVKRQHGGLTLVQYG